MHHLVRTKSQFQWVFYLESHQTEGAFLIEIDWELVAVLYIIFFKVKVFRQNAKLKSNFARDLFCLFISSRKRVFHPGLIYKVTISLGWVFTSIMNSNLSRLVCIMKTKACQSGFTVKDTWSEFHGAFLLLLTVAKNEIVWLISSHSRLLGWSVYRVPSCLSLQNSEYGACACSTFISYSVLDVVHFKRVFGVFTFCDFKKAHFACDVVRKSVNISEICQ